SSHLFIRHRTAIRHSPRGEDAGLGQCSRMSPDRRGRSYAGAVADPIVIVDYDPARPSEFDRLRERARRAAGEIVVSIEHVGSTAVPTLAAKPVIDLIVVVQPGDVETAIERLAAIGYVHEGNWGVE